MSLYEDYLKERRRDIISNLPYRSTLDIFDNEVIVQSNPHEIIFKKMGIEICGEDILVRYKPIVK